MNITNILGQLTELKCQIDFCEKGIVLSQPTNPSSRYDFIADINGKLYRIQCKTAHLESNDRISISIQSRNWNNGERHNYIGEIDYFYTNWNNQGYLLPIELCTETNRQKFLRLGEPSQYTSNNCNALYGEDYKIEKILEALGISETITIEDTDRSIIRKSNNAETISKIKTCLKCGKPITGAATFCIDCYKEEKRPKDIPSRDELKELIRTTPFTAIGEKYGRTDNAIRKWCDSYSLPRKKSDINKLTDEEWKLI